MKFFLSFLLLFFTGISSVFAQSENNELPNTSVTTTITDATQNTGSITEPQVHFPACSAKYSILGPTNVKVNTAYEYMLETDTGSTVFPVGTFSLISSGVVMHSQTVDNEKFVHSFGESSTLKMSLLLDSDVFHCQGVLSEDIYVNKGQILYIGTEKSWLNDTEFSSVFRSKSILFENIFTGNNFQLENSSIAWNAIGSADIIILNPQNILSFFTDMEKLQRIKEINFSKKRIYIISSYQRSFLSKVLASSVAKMGITNISLITEDQFSGLLNRWGFSDNGNLLATAGQELSYEKKNFVFTLSSFLEYLVYGGVSYQFLGFLLTLACVTLIFNIFKQVIGLDVFMVYYPLLLAIIFSQMGFSFSLVFVGIAILSLMVVSRVSHYIPLLVNAKKAFLISVYVLVTFLVLGFDNFFNLGMLRYATLDSPLAIIAIFSILFVIERVYDGSFSFSRKGFINIVQYTFILGVAYFILNYQDLQYFLISYPDIIFLIVILNLLVGRYMGLQLAEYLRFSPILRNIGEEE